MTTPNRLFVRADAMVSLVALTAALAVCAPAAAVAATAAATAAAGPDAGNLVELDAVVVTASGNDKTKLKTSMSVNSVSQEQIQAFTPRSEAEVLRMIPGLQVQDTAGPGGNSNIGVRGIPVVTGGSEFVQLQEDGLPTVLFGDMNFGNNDYWTRYDTNITRVEAVRGGGASTFASQAPGAVINYISDTGEHAGGAIGVSKGVNFNETKVDFGYGGRIDDSTRFHIGGFLKDGNGPTHIGYDAEQGYQIKANVTKDLADDKGYVRLTFKRLDDKEPTYTSAPSIVSLSGHTINGFSPLAGYDARTGSNQSILNQSFQVLNYDGAVGRVGMEGIHAKSTSVGAEVHYKVASFLTFDDKFRWTDQSGTFRTQFVGPGLTSGVIGSTVNGATVGSIRYANGPKQGQLFTSPYLTTGPNIDTNMPDMGSLVNDLTLGARFAEMGAAVSLKAGWFHMNQKVREDWHVNPEYNELTGVNPAQLDLFSTTGTQLTAAGQAGFNNNWGNCCARSYDLSYTDDAPYFSADVLLGKFDLDASVREDTIKASGWALGGVAGPNVTVSDALGSATLPSMVAGGALYAFDSDTSLFARISRGGRFNGDRRVLGGNFNADGSLNAQGSATAVNFVTQQEVGVKRRGSAFGASYTAELTGFRAQLTDNNYDFTRLSLHQDPVIANVYHSAGLEFTGSVHYGHFSLYSTATLLSAGIVRSGGVNLATPGVPHALAGFSYVVSPTYDLGKAAVGLTVDGQSSTFTDDTNNGGAYKIPGQTYVNAFLKARPYPGVEAALNVNNLLNTLGYRGSGSVTPLSSTSGIFQNSAVLGRTITASVAYRF